MNGRSEDFSPYWLPTLIGLNDGMPALPGKLPWEYPGHEQSPPATWDPSTLPISSGDGGVLPPLKRSWDSNSPSWLPTASPFGVDLGLPASPSLPVKQSWNYPWPQQSPAAMFDPSTLPIPPALPPTFPPAPPPEHLNSAQYWGTLPAPSVASMQPPGRGFFPSPLPPASSWDAMPTHATATGAAQMFPQPPNALSMSTPAPSANAAGAWPTYEFDLVQDALRAGAESIGRRGRREPIPYPAPLALAPEHVDSANYWGAAPSSASGQSPAQSHYLSPVPQAPSWEQVVPTATPWSVFPQLPSPTSWGDVTSGIDCHTSGGNLHCLTLGGRQFTVPATGLPDEFRMAPGEPGYHYYSKPDGPVAYDPSMLLQDVINSPTPGPRQLVRPATPQGTLNEATPYVGRRPPINPVMSYLTTDQNGTPMIVNVTQPGHGLAPGIVIRYVTTSPSGSTIQNEGTGLGKFQGPGNWGFARDQINEVWEGQSKRIIEGQSRPDVPRRQGQPLGR